ncbi:unnamed protein product, partial [Dicrocoelium dendriticum]
KHHSQCAENVPTLISAFHGLQGYSCQVEQWSRVRQTYFTSDQAVVRGPPLVTQQYTGYKFRQTDVENEHQGLSITTGEQHSDLLVCHHSATPGRTSADPVKIIGGLKC